VDPLGHPQIPGQHLQHPGAGRRGIVPATLVAALRRRRAGALSHHQQVGRGELRGGQSLDRLGGALDRRLETERPEHRSILRNPQAPPERPTGTGVHRRRQRHPHGHHPDPDLRVLGADPLGRPAVVDQHPPLAPQERPVRRQLEQHGLDLRPPPARPRRLGADPAVVRRQAPAVALEIDPGQVLLGQQVVEHQVVQGQHPRPRERHPLDRLVVAVVAHLVERQTPFRRGALRRHDAEPLHDVRIDRLAGKAQHPHGGALDERRQQVDRVVGDAGVDRRQGGDEVEGGGAAAGRGALHQRLRQRAPVRTRTRRPRPWTRSLSRSRPCGCAARPR